MSSTRKENISGSKTSKKTIDQKLDGQDTDLDEIISSLNETIEISEKAKNELDKSKQKISEARITTKEVSANMDIAGRNLNDIKKRSGLVGFFRSIFEK